MEFKPSGFSFHPFLSSRQDVETFLKTQPHGTAVPFRNNKVQLLLWWDGKKVCEKREDNKHQRILKCTFKPGVGHERHYHLPHFGYTLEGSTFKIKDTTGTRIVNVKTGSYFNNKGIEWHEVINIGDSTAVFLIIEPK